MTIVGADDPPPMPCTPEPSDASCVGDADGDTLGDAVGAVLGEVVGEELGDARLHRLVLAALVRVLNDPPLHLELNGLQE